ncbi:Galactokinase [bioreactor metagenome]|uniref:Galactokinase n=1 Tax=bioreactor metagenome TaxID=1076179 RepID=A0A645FEM2_9ZZZZ
MEGVASLFGKQVLREVDENGLFDKITEIRKKFGDRAFLRAMHFFEENKRVEKEVTALKNKNFDAFKKNVIESGQSSYMYNQNVYPAFDVCNQSVSVALCIAEKILKDKGAWRVHGGGFAGTMQAFVPNELLDIYLTEMKKVFGENSCYVLSIRPYGGIKVL